ncbi:hypothetical protein ATANTOWER_004834 [Ataeniobius toweri]|uniref:Uncharacterized protein n=1 Tax=Ataeniobius toweri TaxID=208326 RepID=A0ABU7BMQ9_9TELE|nr:hypothetical protein [Ataeniobius toweri]
MDLPHGKKARDVLKNISAGKCSSKKEPLHQDSALPANQNAVVVCNGQIYLCIRKARRKQQKTRKLQLSSKAAIPSTAGLRSTSSTKELISGRQKIKADTGKVKGCEKAAELKRKGGSADKAEYSGPCPSDGGHRADGNTRYFKAPRKELASEETALQPLYVQPQEKQEHPTNRVVVEYDMNNLGEEEGSVWANDMDRNQMDSQDDENAGNNGWMMMKSLGAAGASTSKHMDIDFNELEKQEKIAQLKAKFMQKEAALNDLLS